MTNTTLAEAFLSASGPDFALYDSIQSKAAEALKVLTVGIEPIELPGFKVAEEYAKISPLVSGNMLDPIGPGMSSASHKLIEQITKDAEVRSSLFESAAGFGISPLYAQMQESIKAFAPPISFTMPTGIRSAIDSIASMQSSVFDAIKIPDYGSQFSALIEGLVDLPQFKIPAFDISPSFGDTTTVPIVAPTKHDVDHWLGTFRSDLPGMRRGMWWTLEHNPFDGPSQAIHSALELVIHLFDSLGARDDAVRDWAPASGHASEAVVERNGYLQVTWRGRLRLGAVLAGFDEVGQDLVVSYASTFGKAQPSKHHGRELSPARAKSVLEAVEELLDLLFGSF